MDRLWTKLGSALLATRARPSRGYAGAIHLFIKSRLLGLQFPGDQGIRRLPRSPMSTESFNICADIHMIAPGWTDPEPPPRYTICGKLRRKPGRTLKVPKRGVVVRP